MKYKTQDPKFFIENNRLVGQSGLIPDDEPIFILRARDINAVDTLIAYINKAVENGCDGAHAYSVGMRTGDFIDFRRNHPDRMKIPDTKIADLHNGRP